MYSQHGEDAYIKTLFPDNYKGVFIEVGAYDGISLSNTYHFELNGWRALCIEPILSAFEKCKAIRKECYKCCISDNDKEDAEFFIYHLQENLCAISSLIPDQRLIDSHSHMITNTSKEMVNVRSLNSLLKEFDFPKKIDFISIDTENTEFDVLKGIDLTVYDVTLFVIENNFNEPQCEEYLKQFGYTKINRIAVNDFFWKEPKKSNDTITYVGGGLLGDFIHQMSVICEKWKQTNKKGILYMDNRGDQFRFGLENTYNELYPFVIIQDYIADFKIRSNNEQYDIDLSLWRNEIFVNGNNNFIKIMNNRYNILWAQNKWLSNIPINNLWNDKIVINTTDQRFPKEDYIQKIRNYKDKTQMVFVGSSINEYKNFQNKTGINDISYYCPANLSEMIIIINSCKYFMGSLSAPLSIATALHKPCTYMFTVDHHLSVYMYVGIDEIIPYIKI